MELIKYHDPEEVLSMTREFHRAASRRIFDVDLVIETTKKGISRLVWIAQLGTGEPHTHPARKITGNIYEYSRRLRDNETGQYLGRSYT